MEEVMRRILMSTFVASVAAISLSTEVLAADWIVRSRLTLVAPDASSNNVAGVGTLDVDNNITLGLDITRFFTPNLAAEIILGTTTHEVVASVAGSIGSVSVLPPTLVLQYHFSPNANFRPYAGIGINYTIFYNKTGNTLSTLDLDDSFGFAAQVGADWMLTNRASINFDVKYVNIETEVSNNTTGAKLFDLDINPWVIGLGVGYRF
jgi:outer membrane protein